jgi:hypothetical protein
MSIHHVATRRGFSNQESSFQQWKKEYYSHKKMGTAAIRINNQIRKTESITVNVMTGIY